MSELLKRAGWNLLEFLRRAVTPFVLCLLFGMTMFAGCRIIRDEVMTDADMLAAYIRDSLGGVIGSVYGNPAGDGRIRFQ